MIFCNLMAGDNFSAYALVLRKVLAYLRSTDITALPVGKHPIQGEQIYAVISDLQTRPLEEIPPEIHRRYIDVHYWQNSSEVFGVAPYRGTELMLEEHPENDTWYLAPPENENLVTTEQGSVAIFFPWDIHRPGGMSGVSEKIRKCVVKVDMALLKGDC